MKKQYFKLQFIYYRFYNVMAKLNSLVEMRGKATVKITTDEIMALTRIAPEY